MIQTQTTHRRRITDDLEQTVAAREAAYHRHDWADAVALGERIDALLDEMNQLEQ